MRVELHFTVDVDEAGLARYYERYPELADLDKHDPKTTLHREAWAAWDFEDFCINPPYETDHVEIGTVEVERR